MSNYFVSGSVQRHLENISGSPNARGDGHRISHAFNTSSLPRTHPALNRILRSLHFLKRSYSAEALNGRASKLAVKLHRYSNGLEYRSSPAEFFSTLREADFLVRQGSQYGLDVHTLNTWVNYHYSKLQDQTTPMDRDNLSEQKKTALCAHIEKVTREYASHAYSADRHLEAHASCLISQFSDAATADMKQAIGRLQQTHITHITNKLYRYSHESEYRPSPAEFFSTLREADFLVRQGSQYGIDVTILNAYVNDHYSRLADQTTPMDLDNLPEQEETALCAHIEKVARECASPAYSAGTYLDSHASFLIGQFSDGATANIKQAIGRLQQTHITNKLYRYSNGSEYRSSPAEFFSTLREADALVWRGNQYGLNVNTLKSLVNDHYSRLQDQTTSMALDNLPEQEEKALYSHARDVMLAYASLNRPTHLLWNHLDTHVQFLAKNFPDAVGDDIKKVIAAHQEMVQTQTQMHVQNRIPATQANRNSESSSGRNEFPVVAPSSTFVLRDNLPSSDINVRHVEQLASMSSIQANKSPSTLEALRPSSSQAKRRTTSPANLAHVSVRPTSTSATQNSGITEKPLNLASVSAEWIIEYAIERAGIGEDVATLLEWAENGKPKIEDRLVDLSKHGVIPENSQEKDVIYIDQLIKYLALGSRESNEIQVFGLHKTTDVTEEDSPSITDEKCSLLDNAIDSMKTQGVTNAIFLIPSAPFFYLAKLNEDKQHYSIIDARCSYESNLNYLPPFELSRAEEIRVLVIKRDSSKI